MEWVEAIILIISFFLLLGIIGILIYFGSTDYNVVFASIEHFATYKDFGINGNDSLY